MAAIFKSSAQNLSQLPTSLRVEPLALAKTFREYGPRKVYKCNLCMTKNSHLSDFPDAFLHFKILGPGASLFAHSMKNFSHTVINIVLQTVCLSISKNKNIRIL